MAPGNGGAKEQRKESVNLDRPQRGLSRYIRPNCPGATVFFTVTLTARGSDLLVR